MSIPLSPQRIKKALRALEQDFGDLGTVDGSQKRLSRSRLKLAANDIEQQIAVVEAAAVSNSQVTFTAPARSRLVRNNIQSAQAFINSLRTRVEALEDLFALTSVDPATDVEAGGAALTFTGLGFDPAVTFTIGGASVTSVVWVSPTEATGVAPAGTAGAQDVVATNPGPVTSTLTGGFTYT